MTNPEPGSWRLESNEFEREVALAILANPGAMCLDIPLIVDTDGNVTTDRSVQFSKADIAEIMLLDDKNQRKLHRKFYFQTLVKVRLKSLGEFPDAKTLVIDVESFSEKNLIDFARDWLKTNGYEKDYFLWGPIRIDM
jgi:hypothetical protein